MIQSQQNQQFNQTTKNTFLKTLTGIAGMWARYFATRPAYIDLSKVVKDTIATNLSKVPAKQVTIIEDIDDNVLLDGCQTKLKRVFEQLIAITIKCAPLGLKVKTRLKAVQGNILFEIKHNGRPSNGFRPEEIDKLHQALNSIINHGQKAIGPTPPVTRANAELNKGDIWVISNGKTCGTKLIVETQNDNPANTARGVNRVNALSASRLHTYNYIFLLIIHVLTS